MDYERSGPCENVHHTCHELRPQRRRAGGFTSKAPSDKEGRNGTSDRAGSTAAPPSDWVLGRPIPRSRSRLSESRIGWGAGAGERSALSEGKRYKGGRPSFRSSAVPTAGVRVRGRWHGFLAVLLSHGQGAELSITTAFFQQPGAISGDLLGLLRRLPPSCATGPPQRLVLALPPGIWWCPFPTRLWLPHEIPRTAAAETRPRSRIPLGPPVLGAVVGLYRE